MLTLLPEGWSPNKISKEFGCSWDMAKRSQKLQNEAGKLEKIVDLLYFTFLLRLFSISFFEVVPKFSFSRRRECFRL